MTGSDADPEVGDVIAGRYRIEGPLGSGAMGTVWRATQLALGRTVALKLLAGRQASSPEARARFAREARVASAVEHPGVVAIHDFGEHEGAPFLAMELIAGRTLRDVLAHDRASLTVERIVDIGVQIAEVLIATHAIGLVHRDLKPENVFVRDDGTVVVGDFGLAFIDQRQGDARMTADGVVTGTPDYMSPEQARGDRVGPPTDVYALGCMLFEMLTGRTLFAGQPMMLLTQHMFAPAPRVSEVRGALSVTRVLEDLVRAMVGKSESARPTAEQVRDTLLEATPAGSDARERGRDRTFLLGREARVLPRAEADRAIAQPDPSAAIADEAITVAIVGEPSGDLVVGLTASGLVPYVATTPSSIAEASVIYAPGAGLAEIEALAKHGAPVISDTDAADIPRIAALARAGAADVVPRPVGADELARRIFRAHKRARRSRRNG